MIWYHGVKMGYKLGICFFWFKWAVWLLPWQPLELLGVRADSNLPWTRSRRNTLDSGENHPNRSCLWFLHGSNLLRLSSADQVQMWICSGSALKLHGKNRSTWEILHRQKTWIGFTQEEKSIWLRAVHPNRSKWSKTFKVPYWSHRSIHLPGKL
jgi:hypothetical protein